MIRLVTMIIGARDGIDLILIVQDSKKSCSLVGMEYNFTFKLSKKSCPSGPHFHLLFAPSSLIAPSSLNSCSSWSLEIGVQIGKTKDGIPQLGASINFFPPIGRPTSSLAMGAMYMG